RDAQPARDALQDLGGRLAQPALDLAQIRVGDAGQLAELAQRQTCVAALIANEVAEVVQPRFEKLRRLGSHPVLPETRRSASTRSIASITRCSWPRTSERWPSNVRSALRVSVISSSEIAGRFASVVSTTSCSRPSGQCSSIVGASAAGAPRVVAMVDLLS